MTPANCKRCGAPLSSAPIGGGASESGPALQGMCTKCLFELGLEEDSSVVITGAYEAPAPPPTPQELQPLFPNHVIEEVLGQGGMGVVYRARQKGLDRPVAIKVLPAKAGRDPAFAERFTREAKALASLNHPNITNIYDFGKAGEHHFLVMELVDGANLRQLLRTSKIAPKQALQIVEQICDALQYAHDEGVVHRDIKPENILIDRKGRLKITDFGLAKLLGREDGATGLTMSHQVMGTPHYMAPEQVEHPTEVDHRADIYSLGVVFYELLTGELPLGRFAPPSGKVQIDVKLDEVVLRALAKEPSLRYQTAGAVKTDVHGIHEPGTGAEATPESRARAAAQAGAPAGGAHAHRGGFARNHQGRPLWPLILAAGAVGTLGLLAVFGAGFLFLGRSQEAGREAVVREVDALQGRLDTDAVLAASRTAAKLQGIDLFGLTDDRPTVSTPFREAFALAPETARAVTDALARSGGLYGALLDAHTSIEVTSPSRTHVELAPFPEGLDALIADFERELFALLPLQAGELLRARDSVRTELFGQGAVPVAFDLRTTDDGFAWTATEGGVTKPGDEVEMPWLVRRYWDMRFHELLRPLGPSALPVLTRVLDEIKVLRADGTEVDLMGVDVSSRSRTVTPVRVKLDLLVTAENNVRANELLGRMLERIRATGATAQLGSTRVESDGKGIRATSIELWFPAATPALPGPMPGREPGDASHALRAVAAESGVGEVTISVKRVYTNDAFEDDLYSVDFGDGAVALEPVLAWARRVEETVPQAVVTEISLDPAKGAEGLWRVKAELLARHPR